MGVNSIVYSGIGDLALSEAISGQYLAMLHDDRALPNEPALTYVGRINDMRSNVIKVPHIGLGGYDIMSQTADGATVANTALTDSSSTVTVVRYSKAYSATDLAKMTSGGLIDPAAFAADAFQAFNGRLAQLACDAGDGFTLTGGTTTVDLDAADILATLGLAEINNLRGPFMCVLHGQQWSDLSVDLGTAVGGSLQFAPATPELIAYKSTSFKGSWLGVNFYVLNRVNADGADRLGFLAGPGSLLWADGAPPVEDSSQQMAVGSNILFERDRDAKAGETAYVQHAYAGLSIGLQNGITIKSDQ